MLTLISSNLSSAVGNPREPTEPVPVDEASVTTVDGRNPANQLILRISHVHGVIWGCRNFSINSMC